MGASLGLALKKQGYQGHITGYARRAETRNKALELGIVDSVCSDPANAAAQADIIVLCVPILSIANIATSIAPQLKQGAIVTDVGSTKSVLQEILAPLFADTPACFIGSHPIAGSEKTGIEAGHADLYNGRLTILCPAAASAEQIHRLESMWSLAGSEVRQLSPVQHDALLAATSHLPHMVSAALVYAVAEGKLDSRADFCGTGFQSATRIASGSPNMWVDIIDTNREALSAELLNFREEIDRLIHILGHDDSQTIYQWLNNAAQLRDNLLEKNTFLKK